MGTIAPTIPTVNQPRYTEETDSRTALSTILTLVNGNIDGANARAFLSQYRTFVEAETVIFGSSAAGVYMGSIAATTNICKSGTAAQSYPVLVPFVAADHAVTGLTTVLRLRVFTTTNGTAPGISYTYGMYPISSIAGSGNTINLTVGAVVAGSTVTRTTPAASSGFVDASADFAIPSDGRYVLGVSTSGAQGTGSVGCGWELQVRNT